MPYVVNVTPFQALGIEHRFYNGHPYDCLFVKGSFRLGRDGSLRPLIEQPPFVLNDIHEADEDSSALRYPSEIIPFKPATDVVFVGSAKAPGNRPLEQWIAHVQVGGIDKSIRLTGPRQWRHKRLGKWELTPIEPCTAVPLSYALAYGGASAERHEADDIFWPNPFGRGFRGKDKSDRARQYDAPRILSLSDGEPEWAVDMRAVGLSPVDGKQMERLQFAGTYDERWKREVAPNIPLDMRLEFWNVVPQDQVVKPYLEGGEQVRTAGLFPTDDGVLNFMLPRYQVLAVPVRGNTKESALPMDIDTVLVDLDKRHVVLRWATLCSQAEGYDEYQLVAVERQRAAATTGTRGRTQ